MTKHVWTVISLLLAGWIAGETAAFSVDLSGSIRVIGGPLDTDGRKSDQLDQRYALDLFQSLTPWLSLRLTYRLNEFLDAPEGGPDFERRSREPALTVLYNRGTFSARVTASDRKIRGTSQAENLDIRSLNGSLRWRPRKGPGFSLSYRADSNLADSAIFGRDTDTRSLAFSAFFDRTLWSARYSFRDSEIANNLSQLEIQQREHRLRTTYSNSLLQDRFLVSIDAWASRVDQSQTVPTGAALSRPVSASQGLYALDTSPEAGALESSPGLVDGDVTSPVDPRIEIGGANTFRNIGVDLGLTRQVSQLEVTVDRPSASVVWQVFHSSDNLNWQQIQGVTSGFDNSFLRYSLRFPETTDRYFKAVNTTPNSFTEVAVTEIRALIDVDRLGRQEGDSNTYRADASFSYEVGDRVDLAVTAGFRNDEDLAGGLLSRDVEEFNYSGQLQIDLARSWEFQVAYRFSDFEERLDPVLQREDRQFSANLEWNPLPELQARLTGARRQERDDGELIRSVDTLNLRAWAQLLPQLRTTAVLTYSWVDDPFSGFEQTSWRWSGVVEARPTPNWTLDGSITRASFDSTGSSLIESRDDYRLLTTYRVTPYLSIRANWNLSQDDLRRTLTQRYGVSWNPGRKLSASAQFEEVDSRDLRRTTNSSLNGRYALNRWANVWANLAQSRLESLGQAETTIDSLRVGLNLLF